MAETTEKSAVKKVSKSETGHAVNMANFAVLIAAVKNFGTAYKPSAANITLSALETFKSEIDTVQSAYQTALVQYKDAVNNRQNVFEKMNPLTTRVNGAVKAFGIDKKTINEIVNISKKIKGARITVEKNDTGTKSVSQVSYDNKTQNFKLLVARLQNAPDYKPNENDLSMDGLKAYIETLDGFTTCLNKAKKDYEKAIRDRNTILYNHENGVVTRAGQIKEYVKSIYGFKAPEYKTVSKIKFLNLSN